MTPPGLPTPDGFSPFYVLPGTRIGPYAVRRAIGRGGAQMAYLADTWDGRRVVLKISLFPKGETGSRQRLMHERFLRQVTFFLQLRGVPGVANVFAHDMHPDASPDGHLYMVQEWVPDSINILDWYRREPHSLDAVVAGWMILANACGEMDRRGICHRDLKPENILVSPLGAPKIVDFNSGLSVGAERLTFEWASKVPGTFSYKSPELCEAILEEWATRRRKPFQFRPSGDLHALGVIFYQVLTGEHPFDEQSEEVELYEQVAHHVPALPRSLNPDVPFGLEKVTMRLLQKDPEQRYQSGDELVEELEALLTTGEDWSRPFQTPPGKRHTPRRRTSRTSTGSPPPSPTSVGSAALNLAPSAIVLAPPRALAVIRSQPRLRLAPAPAPRRRRAPLLAAVLALALTLVTTWHDSTREIGTMLLSKTKAAVVAAASTVLAACAGLVSARAGDKEWLSKCPPEVRNIPRDMDLQQRGGVAWMKEGPNVVIPRDGGLEVKSGPFHSKAVISTTERGIVGFLHGEIRTGSDGASIRFTKFVLDDKEIPVCAIGRVQGRDYPGIPIAVDPPPDSQRTPGFMFVTTGALEVEFAPYDRYR